LVFAVAFCRLLFAFFEVCLCGYSFLLASATFMPVKNGQKPPGVTPLALVQAKNKNLLR
jgi:hypothetical protein